MAVEGIFITTELEGELAKRIHALQLRFDPKMANYLPPHITLIGSSGAGPVPSDTPLAVLKERILAVTDTLAPVTLRFGPPDDEGRLTDGKGRTVDFKNTVLIMTSNVASDLIQESAERDIPNLKGRLMDALRKTFRPEFLNRIDEIVTFGALGEDQIRRIVEIQFKDLQKRVAEKKIEITLSPEAATLLAHVGYDPVFGARPLKRAIQRMVENPLALQILAGHFREGDKLTIEPTKDGDLAFRQDKRKSQAA